MREVLRNSSKSNFCEPGLVLKASEDFSKGSIPNVPDKSHSAKWSTVIHRLLMSIAFESWNSVVSQL